jgi:preprotein translocase subunit SecD
VWRPQKIPAVIFYAAYLCFLSDHSSAQDVSTSPPPVVVYQITATQLQTLKTELSRLKQEQTTLRENLLSLKLLSTTQETALSELQKTLDEATRKQSDLQQLSDSLEMSLKTQIELSSNLESKLTKAGESLTQALTDSRLQIEALKQLNQSLSTLKQRVNEEKLIIGVVSVVGGILVGVGVSRLLQK